uniref:Uncharacterized protein n=1 Tax=Nelumbo nucifera TaxID=4432 RepID=A0A822XD24_NELNU|nr:TPA_asm: hypothetical protein HUJ06_020797 [Nelumbo nucifera]
MEVAVCISHGSYLLKEVCISTLLEADWNSTKIYTPLRIGMSHSCANQSRRRAACKDKQSMNHRLSLQEWISLQ